MILFLGGENKQTNHHFKVLISSGSPKDLTRRSNENSLEKWPWPGKWQQMNMLDFEKKKEKKNFLEAVLLSTDTPLVSLCI